MSNRQDTEKALRESETRYRQLLKHAPAGIYEIDFIHRKFISANDVICEYTGYTKEEFLSLDPMDILTEESRALCLERMNKILSGESVPESVEMQIRGKHGREFWVILYSRTQWRNGLPTGATVIAHDITQRRLAEEALRKSEERYRHLVEHSTEGIFILQDHSIKFPNPKALQILRYSAAELAALDFTDLVREEDRFLIRELYRKAEDKPSKGATVRIADKTGEEIWLKVNAVPMHWDGAAAILHLFRDVTHQKKLEAQLMHAQKMEAIGTLAGGIAHNFNNLLMGIQGNISLMLLESAGNPGSIDRLLTVQKLIESGSKLTGQLLGYARGGKHEAKPMDLNALVRETSQIFGLTKKEIAIHLDLSAELWHAAADRNQLEEVLMNLFVNAADAMPRGGDLFLASRNVTEGALRGKPFKAEPGRYVHISVRDTGIGMDRKTMARIFDPFFTTKPVGQGTGLGLASAYGIIKAHGGYIDVESEKGAGTCLSLYLPASDQQMLDENVVPPRPMKGAETLLVVDDEESVLLVAQLMLEKLGYHVLAASNSRAAIEIFNTNRERIDMVILDMIMPDMGGGMLYRRLKALDPALKALLSSGYSLDGQATEILKEGCNGFIQKPFGAADLSRKIRSILDGPMALPLPSPVYSGMARSFGETITNEKIRY